MSATCGYAEINPARLGPLDAAACALADAGARVEPEDPPIWNIRHAYVILCETAFAGAVAGMSPERMALLDPVLIETARRGMMISAAVARQADSSGCA